MYKIIFPFLSLTLLISCHRASKKSESNSNNTITDTISKVEIAPGDEQNIFEDYDAIQKCVDEWNNAINNKDTEKLGNIYSEKVAYYLDIQSSSECVSRKIKWLNEHAGYKQQINKLEIYYLESDTNVNTLIAEFEKRCVDKNVVTEIPSMLYFTRSGDKWKLTKETDLATEAAKALKAPVRTLNPGEYTFYRGYYTDTRDMENFVHDEVPYRFTLSLNVDDSITGSYSVYSGSLRETFNHLIIGGKIENGILKFTTIFDNGYDISDYPKDAEKEHWQYKIINGTELISLDKDNDFLYGKSLWLENDRR